MHGVARRVKTSIEVEKEKKQAELIKIQKYQQLTDQIAKMRKENIFNKAAMELSAKLLEMSSEFYSIWNYRKQILLHYSQTLTQKEMEPIIQDELKMLQGAIRNNPKSYWVFLHRVWVMQLGETLGIPADWNLELMLCEKLLAVDERNFHCWNYRRYVAKKANVPFSQEFDFTTKKIEEKFSNYSAWHQRSFFASKNVR